jgi:hypothetical protein
MNFPINISTKKQRATAKKAALKAQKRPLTKWQITKAKEKKEQRVLDGQELLFMESLSVVLPLTKSTKKPKSPAKPLIKNSSHTKAYSQALKTPPKLFNKVHFPLPESLQLMAISRPNPARLAAILATNTSPLVRKGARGRILKASAKASK